MRDDDEAPRPGAQAPKGQRGGQARGAAAPRGSGSPGPGLRLASVPEGGQEEEEEDLKLIG